MMTTRYPVSSSLLLLLLSFPVLADSELDNCYKSDIDYSDDPSLTQAERLEVMNAAFFDSINRFEECVLSNTSSTASSGSSGGSGAGTAGGLNNGELSGTEGEEGDAEQGTNPGSVASSELSGTELQSIDAEMAAEQMEIDEQTVNVDESVALNQPVGQGKEPEDIPPAANDDAVAAQIRLAAEMETDPEKKARLWNEYRKYKGIPVKDNE